MVYLKMAAGNVRRSFRDYSVYFAGLCLAVCLLYSFNAGIDHLLVLDLSADQRELYAQAGGVVQAFSVFVAVVFLLLVCYASRFLLRRRRRELALYGVLGMPFRAICAVLFLESLLTGTCAFVSGVVAGMAWSPLLDLCAAVIFGAPRVSGFSFSPAAAQWCAACFAFVGFVLAALSACVVCRKPLAELLAPASRPENMRFSGRRAVLLQSVVAAALLSAVWGACLAEPSYFVLLVLPFGLAAGAGTYVLVRALVGWLRRAVPRQEKWYLRELNMLAVKRTLAQAEAASGVLACASVLLAAGTCMMYAGLSFSVGMRAAGLTEAAWAFAPIGYIGVFCGAAFLLAAVSVLALRQLAETGDRAPEFEMLAEQGVDASLVESLLRKQVGFPFAVALALACAHDVFGMHLVGTLAAGAGAFRPGLTLGLALAATAAAAALFFLATYRACRRGVSLSGRKRESGLF